MDRNNLQEIGLGLAGRYYYVRGLSSSFAPGEFNSQCAKLTDFLLTPSFTSVCLDIDFEVSIMVSKPQKELNTLEQGVREFVCNSFRDLRRQNRLRLRLVVINLTNSGRAAKKLEEDHEARQWLSNLG
jgi:hypothetical protein